MEFRLLEVNIHPAHDGSKPSVGARLHIVFPNPKGILISGAIGLTFEHESPHTLTMGEIETLAIAEARAAL